MNSALQILFFVGMLGGAPPLDIRLAESLFPLYTEKELVLDPALAGVWMDKEGHQVCAIRKSSGKSYEVRIPDEPERLVAHLVRLGKFLFLDLRVEEGNLFELRLPQSHVIFRAWLRADVMRLAVLDNGWIEERIARGDPIDYTRLEGGAILTAPPRELQQFLRKHAEDPKAFPDVGELHRRK